MPGFDGTGPRYAGPMTGRCEGYCAIRLPDDPDQPVEGYLGLDGMPVRLDTPLARASAADYRMHPIHRMWSRFAFGRGRGGRRGRGRCLRYR
ncbi:MAG: DUF5320 domain-containing protein [Chloroflexi bacterium]|nr:DUF5320 domain-containing protein [Chloroflexota bacterium]